jgi:hypothetical protein
MWDAGSSITGKGKTVRLKHFPSPAQAAGDYLEVSRRVWRLQQVGIPQNKKVGRQEPALAGDARSVGKQHRRGRAVLATTRFFRWYWWAVKTPLTEEMEAERQAYQP